MRRTLGRPPSCIVAWARKTPKQQGEVRHERVRTLEQFRELLGGLYAGWIITQEMARQNSDGRRVSEERRYPRASSSSANSM
jgi:hypothetical protein